MDLLTTLSGVLEEMEDEDMDTNLTRTKNYTTIINALKGSSYLDAKTEDRLVAICIKDMTRTDLQYSSSAILVITQILKKIKQLKADYIRTGTQLNESCEIILNLLTKEELFVKPLLRKMSIEALVHYPDDILISLISTHTPAINQLLDYRPRIELQAVVTEITEQICSILTRLLQVLPTKQKAAFVEQSLPVWFKSVIPGILHEVESSEGFSGEIIVTLELLTECVIQYDYLQNMHWMMIRDDICDRKRYPQILKEMVDKKSDYWHRLWMVFIKLLKGQITTVFNTSAISPINALLPVVEIAFKLDSKSRCRAFECWNVLIDSFSKEVNENSIDKRLKLLIIPLQLNNAKVEETVLAKLETWWLLIQRFYSKMDNYAILISFLAFCFGKSVKKPGKGIAPGQISSAVAVRCAESLVEIIGHQDCSGCVSIPKLPGKLLNTALLARHWNDWVYSLITAIKTLVPLNTAQSKQQITCLWSNFVITIGTLPENQIRADMFGELLKNIRQFMEPCTLMYENKCDTTFNIILSSLFHVPGIKHLLKSKNKTGPLKIIFDIIVSMGPSFNGNDKFGDTLSTLKPMTALTMDNTLSDPDDFIEHILEMDFKNNLLLWASFAEAICDSKHDLKAETLMKFILLPLKLENFLLTAISDVLLYYWYTLYSYSHPRLGNALDDEVLKASSATSNIHFQLCSLLALLKQKFVSGNVDETGASYLNEAQLLLLNLRKSKSTFFSSLQCKEKILPILIDTLVLLLNKSSETLNYSLAECGYKMLKTVLDHINDLLKKNEDVTITLEFAEMILAPLPKLFQVDAYQLLIPTILNSLTEFDSILKNTSSKSKIAPEILESLFSVPKVAGLLKRKTAKEIKNVDKTTPSKAIKEIALKKTKESGEFSAPEVKSAKKNKKKEPNIVNTVVENGEEFVVVKSNWKFNPRKLTENQKEKLKRKREDIPALYQDLSQSQDEFKLVTWKTESQDTTTSKSTSNSVSAGGDVGLILKNIESTDVVPKIMENICSEKKPIVDSHNKTPQNNNKPQKSTPGPKPGRMALKDRVYRNIKNLSEKSGFPNDIPTAKDDLNRTINEDCLKTPVTKAKVDASVTNSAPSKLTSERPSRSIKAPKKFMDSKIYALKKSTRSQGSASSDTSSEGCSTPTNELIRNYLIVSKTVDVDNKIKENITDEVLPEAIVQQNKKKIEPEDLVKLNKKGLPEAPVHTDTQNLPENIQKEPEQTTITPELSAEATDNVNMKNDKPTTIIQSSPSVKNKELVVILRDTISPQPNKTLSQESNEVKEDNDICSQNSQEVATPTSGKKKKDDDNPTVKKKRSRIERQLLIDMVEGHPVLQESQTPVEKRTTRKKILEESNDTVSKRRKALVEKSQKIKAELINAGMLDESMGDKENEVKSSSTTTSASSISSGNDLVSLPSSQDGILSSSQDLPMSEDVIESSQDSSLTTISVRSSAKKKVPLVLLEKDKNPPNKSKNTHTQKLLDDFDNDVVFLNDSNASRDDIQLSKNKTALEESVNLTETMDTEPMNSSDVEIIINDEVVAAIVINTEDTAVGKDTQEMAEADTLPMEVDTQSIPSTDEISIGGNNKDTSLSIGGQSQGDNDGPTREEITEMLLKEALCLKQTCGTHVPTEENIATLLEIETKRRQLLQNPNYSKSAFADLVAQRYELLRSVRKGNKRCKSPDEKVEEDNDRTHVSTQDDITLSISKNAEAIADIIAESSNTGSPSKVEESQRKIEFLSDTFELSPIKALSPIREEKKSLSPETSNDYVLIKLAAPVQSNGEPYNENCDSPEVFTEGKVSPDKNEVSPPRKDSTANSTGSPSSSLSLKKNRLGFSGRAAQMLGLCAPEQLKQMKERAEVEESKKSAITTPGRRNLRNMIISSAETDDSDKIENVPESMEAVTNADTNFLSFTRELPTSDCSPSVPILKRKLAEIADEATTSPASKRKRVSFHDPPVSTTVAVQKYIEPFSTRSPTSSGIKRAEKQMRAHIKSPKRLDNVFKLETVLSKTVESFSDETAVLISINNSNDTQMSLDVTPALEVVKTSELNDTDPICPELLDCKDALSNIAEDLSSPSTKDLLIKELQGKVETVADLAKMTELEVNRLCIKAPKVKVAKKVLSDYAAKLKIDKVTSTDEVKVPDDPKTVDSINGDSPKQNKSNKNKPVRKIVVLSNKAHPVVPDVQVVKSLATDSAAKTKANKTKPVSTELEPAPKIIKISREVQTKEVSTKNCEKQTTNVGKSIACTQTEAFKVRHCSAQTVETGSVTTKELVSKCLKERGDFVDELTNQLQESSIQQISDKLPVNALLSILQNKMTPSNSHEVVKSILSQTSTKNIDEMLQEYLCKRFDSKELMSFCAQLLLKGSEK